MAIDKKAYPFRPFSWEDEPEAHRAAASSKPFLARMQDAIDTRQKV